MNTTATAADRQFEAIYRTYQRQVSAHIASRLYRADPQLTEDLTAETFLRLWRKLSDGTPVRHPRALLMLMSERAVADHFRRRQAWETATDFTATIASEVPTSPADTPHLAGLFAELEAAKDELAQAAQVYKATRQTYSIACSALATAGSRKMAAARERWERANAARLATLAGFEAAAQLVARVRAEWNAAATEHAALAVA